MIANPGTRNSLSRFFRWIGVAGLLAMLPAAWAQSCFNGTDLDVPTRKAIEGAAHDYLEMSARGDVAGLRNNAIPAITADFGSIEHAVVTNKQFLAEAPPGESESYMLDASKIKTVLPRAEFYCGIYNSAERVSFSIPNLPPGRYAVVIQKINGKDPVTLTLVLQEVSGAWKLAGYYPRLQLLDGHDGQWYLAKARDYKAKGQSLTAWLYYLTAWDLTAPVDFMSTLQLDKLADEMQSARPGDLPSDATPLILSANGKVFHVKEVAAVPVDNALDLQINYQTAGAASPTQASQDNTAVIKAFVAKYPEVREAFNALIARTTDNSGHDYTSLVPVKDIK